MPTQQQATNCKRSTFLRRLSSDRSGNVLAISAAAVLPMIGVVGGAIDVSRMYMVKSRIQAACDSAVLAGRKAMTTNTYDTVSQGRARSMFNFNFQDADYGTTNTSFNASANSEGRLTGNVATTLPMTLMQIFGFNNRTLNVTCSADVQVPNIDIVFVLDVTGSMNDPIPGQTQSKLAGMKAAVIDFRATMDAALVGNTRAQVRYGFVPYSQTVNVASLFRTSPNASEGELPTTHLANTMMVESRVANFNTPVEDFVSDPGSTPIVFNQTFEINTPNTTQPFVSATASGTNISNVDCNDYSSNRSMSIGGINRDVFLWPRTSWPGSSGQGESVMYQPEGSTTWTATEPTNVNAYRRLSFSRVSATWNDDTGNNVGQYRNCTRQVRNERFVKRTRFRFTNWTYKPIPVDVSNYRNGTGFSFTSNITDRTNFLVDRQGEWTPLQLRALPNQAGLASETATWNGCMEERPTTAASNFSPIPAAATDLNYLVGGTNEAMRWRPALPQLTYNRGQPATETTTADQPRPGTACPPVGLRNLNSVSRSLFDGYVNSLQASGQTYHDLGMVWGLRLIAQQGMFASRNLTGTNGAQIARHIIFLTDGEPRPNDAQYTSYGVEQVSQRVRGGSGSSLTRRHNLRFQALCDAQRGRVSIWTIGFGTTTTGTAADENLDTGNLTTCADPGRVFAANNQTQLLSAFRNIAREVADLRLVD